MKDGFAYSLPPISNLRSLARMLRVSEAQLAELIDGADGLYRACPRKKKDGSERTCFDAKLPLKAAQGRIKAMIFSKVYFPEYIRGGVADREDPRDHVRNAERHSGATLAANEDIQDFFPSVTAKLVFDVFRNLMGFPPNVAQALTSLTTRNGQLPQGARTSSHLANMVFWRYEPELFRRLTGMGFRYGRYIDDLTISSLNRQPNGDLGEALSLIHGMVNRLGFRLKRSKHRVMRCDGRIEVTGLVVNRRPSIAKEERRRIRARIHRCEQLCAEGNYTSVVQELASLRGTVAYVARLNPSGAIGLKAQLHRLEESTLTNGPS